MKKIIFFLVLAIFMVTSVSAKEFARDIKDDAYYENNYNLVMIADKLQNFLKEQYNIKEIFNDKYPEYYGGIYISDDAKNIILQIVEKNIPKIDDKDYETYQRIVNFDNLIKVQYVNNTFNELNYSNNTVSKYITSKERNKNIVGCYIDVINNKTVVELLNDDIEIKSELFNYFIKHNNKINANIIKYVVVEQAKTYTYTIESGGEILGRPIGTNYVAVCSMGFRTVYNNQYGYVTAGHCLKYASSVQSGTVLYNRYDNNQYYDYGFVATNSNYTTSNTLAYQSGNIKTLGVVSYCPTITVNMEIAKSGITTEYTSGKVKGLNQTVTYGAKDGLPETIVKGLVKTNVESDEGDSGAPVFIPRTNANGGSIPLGVLSGGSQGIIFGIGRTMYFTSINDMTGTIQSGRY